MRDHLLDEETTFALLTLIPLAIGDLRFLPPERREAAVLEAGPEDGPPQSEAETQSAVPHILARQFAPQAFQPGGVADFGIHACVDPHEGCPASRVWSPHLGAICRIGPGEIPRPPNPLGM